MLSGDVVEGVTALKAHDGGQVVVAGSRSLVHTLLDPTSSTSCGSWSSR